MTWPDLSSSPNWKKDVDDARDVLYVRNILEKYKNFNFVQRIFHPTESINMPSGKTGTHFMVFSEADGRYMVYPRIVDRGNGLELLDKTEAWNWAKKSREMIPFSTYKEALWFSGDKGYKAVWKKKYFQDEKARGIFLRMDKPKEE